MGVVEKSIFSHAGVLVIFCDIFRKIGPAVWPLGRHCPARDGVGRESGRGVRNFIFLPRLE